MPNIDPSEIRQFFSYDADNGELRWRIDNARAKAGNLAGYVCTKEGGRVKVSFRYKTIWAHQIIWVLQTGKWPSFPIDHINQNPSDNRWCNLRVATYAQNSGNNRKHANKYGYRGVFLIKHTGKFGARVVVEKKVHYIGSYATPELAFEAFKDAHKRLHGVFSPYHSDLTIGRKSITNTSNAPKGA